MLLLLFSSREAGQSFSALKRGGRSFLLSYLCSLIFTKPKFLLAATLSRFLSNLEQSAGTGPPKTPIMELISWSLNAIDKIVSSKQRGLGEPACPDGSFASGYVVDFWRSWKGVVCLAPLSVEDVEDVFIFGFMMAGLLIIGLFAGLSYWKIRRTADKFDVQLLLVHGNMTTKAEADWDDELKRKMDNLLGVTAELCRKMDFIKSRLPISEV